MEEFVCVCVCVFILRREKTHLKDMLYHQGKTNFTLSVYTLFDKDTI